MKHALIIIDMQQGSFTDATPRHDAEGLVNRLNSLAGAVRTTNGALIFVQHDGPENDPHHPDLPGWKLLPTLDARSEDAVIRKRSCDAFLHTRLEEFLQSHSIERLIITGCATDYCVDTTVRSALACGYSTIVPSDGHTTMNRVHLPATQRSLNITTPSGRTSSLLVDLRWCAHAPIWNSSDCCGSQCGTF